MHRNILVSVLSLIALITSCTELYADEYYKVIKKYTGTATWYQKGKKTANGDIFYPDGYTAAHKYLPFGTKLRLTNKITLQTVIVIVNDRGPFVPGRDIDVSRGAARDLGIINDGTAKILIEIIKEF